jgi:hypothetical protein
MIFKKFLTKPYFQINLIFAGILMMIFIYSGIFSASRNNYPIPSNYTKLTGRTTVSTGLSRSFSEIMRGRLKKAKEYNPYSIGIFLFFLAQLFLRIFILGLYQKLIKHERTFIITDSILSAFLFVLFFWPFLASVYHSVV